MTNLNPEVSNIVVDINNLDANLVRDIVMACLHYSSITTYKPETYVKDILASLYDSVCKIPEAQTYLLRGYDVTSGVIGYDNNLYINATKERLNTVAHVLLKKTTRITKGAAITISSRYCNIYLVKGKQP